VWGRTAETQASQKTFQSLASLVFHSAYHRARLGLRLHWSNVPVALEVVSDGMVALASDRFSVFEENTYTSAVIEVSAEQEVITTDPIAWFRHPMYAGAFVPVSVYAIALGSWVALPFFLPMLFCHIGPIAQRRKFLSENLKGYKEYCMKVRYHLVPFVCKPIKLVTTKEDFSMATDKKIQR